MSVRFAVGLTTLFVLASLAPPASARPDAGSAAAAMSSVQRSNPLACSVTLVAGRLTRCDYLVAHLHPAT